MKPFKFDPYARKLIGQPDAPKPIPRAIMVLVQLQSGKRCSLPSLADSCKCTTKTIQRTLNALKEAGYEIEYDYDRKSYALAGQTPYHVLSIELAELTALALAETALDSMGDLHLDAALDSALGMVRNLISKKQAGDWDGCRNALLAQSTAKRDYSKAPIQPLVAAAREKKVVEIDYESASSGRSKRLIKPYAIAFQSGFWMVIAYDMRNSEVRKFALDRVYDCWPVEPVQHFEVPKDWSLKEYLACSVGVMTGDPTDIKLKFHPESRVYLEGRLWPFPHKLSKPDGIGQVILTGTVAGLDEISREVLRWGRFVTVLEPPALRDLVVAEARNILAKYE